MKNTEKVVAEIKAYLRENDISVTEAAARLGVSQQAVSNQLSGRKIGANVARNWASAFGFNATYLMTGEGSLLGGSEPSTPENTVPLIPFTVRGGTLQDWCDGATIWDCEPIISPVKGAELAMEVVGDSMAPAFPAGARVLLKAVSADTFVAWGEVFVLDTVNGPVLKRILPTDDSAVWELRSDNPDYPPFRIRTEHVRGVWRVLLRMIQ